MKLKLTALAAVAGAGLFASIALAHGGPGKDNGRAFAFGKNGCHPVRVHGTVAPQTLTVTSTDRNGQTKTTVLQVGGAAGQTVRVAALACQTTTGTSTVVQAKAALLTVHTPRPATTTGATTATTQTGATQTGTTQTVTTSSFRKGHRHRH